MKDEKLSMTDYVAGGGGPRPENIEQPASTGGARMVKEEAPAALFSREESATYRDRWNNIQAGFVDEPRKSAEEADKLVAELMDRLSKIFGEERNRLEGQWDRGDSVSTEDLRVALQRYRSFFNRLLSI